MQLLILLRLSQYDFLWGTLSSPSDPGLLLAHHHHLMLMHLLVRIVILRINIASSRNCRYGCNVIFFHFPEAIRGLRYSTRILPLKCRHLKVSHTLSLNNVPWRSYFTCGCFEMLNSIVSEHGKRAGMIFLLRRSIVAIIHDIRCGLMSFSMTFSRLG